MPMYRDPISGASLEVREASDKDWAEDYGEHAVSARQFSEKILKLCGGYFCWVGGHDDPTNYHIMHSWLNCWVSIPMGRHRMPIAELHPLSRLSCETQEIEEMSGQSLVFSNGAGDGVLVLWVYLP